jgi:hypothetical protein
VEPSERKLEIAPNRGGGASTSCRSQRNADLRVGKFRGILASWTARSGDLAACRLESQRYRQLVDAPPSLPVLSWRRGVRLREACIENGAEHRVEIQKPLAKAQTLS